MSVILFRLLISILYQGCFCCCCFVCVFEVWGHFGVVFCCFVLVCFAFCCFHLFCFVLLCFLFFFVRLSTTVDKPRYSALFYLQVARFGKL